MRGVAPPGSSAPAAPVAALSNAELVKRADEYRSAGEWARAAELYERAATGPSAPAEVWVHLARCYERLGETERSLAALVRVVDASDDFQAWSSAASLLARLTAEARPPARRRARAALIGTYTTGQLAALLPLAALRAGIDLQLYEGAYGQCEQELIDPDSGVYAFDPEYVVVAPHAGALRLPEVSRSPEQDVVAEVNRWRDLWAHVARRSDARVIQHNFVAPPEVAAGHLAARLPGSRYAMTQRVNALLGEAAGDDASIVDCERLAATLGKENWFDDRYWHISKQGVAFEALPMLARHTVAVVAACAGLGRRCLVCDLDNTLWGGLIGEDGLEGIKLGHGSDGEAFVAFQDYIRQLKEVGVVLAVVSRNNEEEARAPFERHPDTRLRLDDFAVFVASWEDKATGLRRVADELGISLDALALVDDNPAERALVRRLLPEVDVIDLPSDPHGYVRALARYPMFEQVSLTAEDADRTSLYRARAGASRLEASAESLEDFHRSLGMEALIAPFDELTLPRVAQLVAKTNQFNLTTRRHALARLRAFAESPDCAHFSLRLRDRFGDHGLVAVMIAVPDGDALEIDTWLMSCRVIGRTVEASMLAELCRRASELGCEKLRGTWIASGRNEVTRDVFARFGFSLLEETDSQTRWEYDIAERGMIDNPFIREWRKDDGNT
jgi:FkbH-like protein